jgi:hypothetical protein
MGLVCGSEKDDPETQRSKLIDKTLKEDRKALLSDVKLLLLGM